MFPGYKTGFATFVKVSVRPVLFPVTDFFSLLIHQITDMPSSVDDISLPQQYISSERIVRHVSRCIYRIVIALPSHRKQCTS